MATKACTFQSHLGFFSKKNHGYLAKPATSPRPVCLICLHEEMRINASAVLEVTDDTWAEQIINSEVPVIVKFWAPSCGPCKVVEPVISELAKEFAGKVACYKINTDDCLETFI